MSKGSRTENIFPKKKNKIGDPYELPTLIKNCSNQEWRYTDKTGKPEPHPHGQ